MRVHVLLVALALLACCNAQVSTRFYQIKNPSIQAPRDVQPRVRVFAGAALSAADVGTNNPALATYTTAVVDKINLSPFIPNVQCQLRWLPVDATQLNGNRPANLAALSRVLSANMNANPNSFLTVETTVDVTFLGYTLSKQVVLRLAAPIPAVTELLVLDLSKDYFKYLDCPTMSINNQMYSAEEAATTALVYGEQAGQEENGFAFLNMADTAQFRAKVENSIVYRLTAPGGGTTEEKMKVRNAPLGNIFLKLVRDWSFTVTGDDQKEVYLWQMPLAIVGGAVRDLYNAPQEAKDVDVAIGLPYMDVKQGLEAAYLAETGEVLNVVSLLSEGLRQQYGMLKVEKKKGEHDGLDIGPFKSFSKEELVAVNFAKFANPPGFDEEQELAIVFDPNLAQDDNAKYLFGFSYRTDTKFRDFTINSLFLEVGNDSPASTDIIVRRLVDGGRTNPDAATGDRLGRSDVKNNVARPTGTTAEFAHDQGMWFRIWKMTNKGFCPSTLEMVDQTCDMLDAWLTEAQQEIANQGTRNEEEAFFFRLRQKLFKVDAKADDKKGDAKAIVAQLHRMRQRNGVYKCFDVWTRIFAHVQTNFAAMCPTTLDANICGGDVPKQTQLVQASDAAKDPQGKATDGGVAAAKLKTFQANQKTYRMMLTAINSMVLTPPDVCMNNPAFLNGVGSQPIKKMTPFNTDNWKKDMCSHPAVKWDGGCPYHDAINPSYGNAERTAREDVKSKFTAIQNKAGEKDVPYSLRYARELAGVTLLASKIQAPQVGAMTRLQNAVSSIFKDQYDKGNKLTAVQVNALPFQIQMVWDGDVRQITMTYQEILRETAKYYDPDLALATKLSISETDKNYVKTNYNSDRKTFVLNNQFALMEHNESHHGHRRRHHHHHRRHHHAKHEAFGSFVELGKRRRQN